jgi:hypothetical protein
LGSVSRLIWAADQMAETYFRGTNVWTYTVVALHDDDMLEDWKNVHTKDPIQLRPAIPGAPVPAPAPRENDYDDEAVPSSYAPYESAPYGSAPYASAPSESVPYESTWEKAETPLGMGGPYETAKIDSAPMFQNVSSTSSLQSLSAFSLFFDRLKSGMDGLGALTNREIEIVKIMLPLQGTQRHFPIEGKVPEDFRSTFDHWMAGEGAALANFYSKDGVTTPPPALPRHFVTYVKQRLVLLDALYALLELLSLLYQSLGNSRSKLRETPTEVLKGQVKNSNAQQAAIAKAVASQPFTKEILVQSALQGSPSLRLTGDWSEYWTRVDVLEKSYGSKEGDRSKAMASAADELALDNEGFGIVKLLLAIDDTPAVEGSLKSIQEAAVRDPLRDSKGNIVEKSLSRQIFRAEDAKAFSNEGQAAVFVAGKSALTEKTVREATGVDSDATVADILSASPEKAADLLGGEAALKTFTQKLRSESQKLAKASETLTIPNKALADDYFIALKKSGGDAEKAVADITKLYSGNSAKSEDLKKLKTLQKAVGSESLAKVATAYFSKAKG